MYGKRLSYTLLLGVGLTVLGSGCAVVDALVSSPAGHSADRSSPERMAAIGRVFESQGHYAKAQAMYRSALQADPGNKAVRERVEYIASLKSKRQGRNSGKPASTAIAAVDVKKTTPTPEPAEEPVVTTPSAEAPAEAQAEVEVIEQSVEETPAVAASAVIPAPELEFETVGTVGTAEASEAATDAGIANIEDTQWELAGLEDETQPSDGWNSVSGAVGSIAPVGFEGANRQTATVASMEAEWTSGSTLVTLDDVMIWMEQPNENRDGLLLALEHGEDDGIRALAAALLVECSGDSEEINRALKSASEGGSDLLKVTALDALVQRGAPGTETVGMLLALLRSESPSIQAQSAASLRNLVGTDWSDQCVDGLGELLLDNDPSVVAVAATTLGDFGDQAASQRPELIKLYDSHHDESVVEAAGLALRRIPSASDVTQVKAVDLPPVSAVESIPHQDVGTYLPVVE